MPRDVGWERFRDHYAVGEDDVDADRAFGDLATYPPIAARIAELKAAGFAGNSGKTGATGPLMATTTTPRRARRSREKSTEAAREMVKLQRTA